MCNFSCCPLSRRAFIPCRKHISESASVKQLSLVFRWGRGGGDKRHLPVWGQEGVLLLSFDFTNLFLRERWKSGKSSLEAKLNEKAGRMWCCKSRKEKSWHPFLSRWLWPGAALCARGAARRGGGLLFKRGWEEGYCAVFSPTKAPNTDSQHKRACLTL